MPLFTLFRQSRSGGVAVEIALSAPIFLILLLGMINYGFEVYCSAQLQRAVRAGAQFSTSAAHATDEEGIFATIKGASELSGIVVEPIVTLCRCAHGDEIACTGATCSDGSAVGHYVTLSAYFIFTPVVSLFSSSPQKLVSSITVRTS
ncbi:putative Pilus assembly protein [Azospirillaceae bacterium]